jgi:hypothetical protein
MSRGLGLVYFEAGVPFVYQGDMTAEREVLRWVKKAVEGDDIEEVNERMLEKAVQGQLGFKAKFGEHDDAAVLFCELPVLSVSIYPLLRSQERRRLLRQGAQGPREH